MRARIRYQPGSSLLHRLHPLVKIAWLFFITIFVFIARSEWIVLGLLLVIIAAFPLSGLDIRSMRGFRLFVTTALLMISLQIIFNQDGDILLNLGLFKITSAGLQTGVYVATRFLSVVFLSYLFVLTTVPNDLAYAMMQIGVPYRYGFALITAIRLVPIFEQEATTVYHAQLTRGVQYDRRNLRRILLYAQQFTLPMLSSALSKVDSLAVSMEGRCFGKYSKRTYLRVISYQWFDYVALLLLLITISTVVLIHYIN